MREYIKKIQSKPEAIRKQIFVGSLIFFMSLVGIIWIGSFSYKFTNNNSVSSEEAIKPFALFGETISETYKNVTASAGNISLSNKESELKEKTPDKVIELIPIEYQ